MGPMRKRLLLSKNLLEMKFMKRTKEKTEKELEDEERQHTFANEITSAMLTHGSKYVIENSYSACQDFTFGRMSFNGMNPELEKLMRKLSGKPPLPVKQEPVLTNEKDADVKAEEVAESLNMTIAKKFARNKPRNRGFKRPAED